MPWRGCRGVDMLMALRQHADMTSTRPSLQMRMVAAVLRLKRKPYDDLNAMREKFARRTYPSAPPPPRRFSRRYAISRVDLAGWPVVTLRPRVGGSSTHVIYCHGGGYTEELIRPHWAIMDRLSRETGATVSAPLYPLAPEYDHRAAFAFMEQVCDHVLQIRDAADIILAGDSAGGNLALATAIVRRDAGHVPFGRVILLSPWLDLVLKDPAARRIEPQDPTLGIDWLRVMGQWWAGQTDPGLPQLSPVNADLTGLPPIDIHQGGNDIFLADARTLAAGNPAGVTLHEYPGAFHVFMGATFLPEAKDVYRRIAQDIGHRA